MLKRYRDADNSSDEESYSSDNELNTYSDKKLRFDADQPSFTGIVTAGSSGMFQQPNPLGNINPRTGPQILSTLYIQAKNLASILTTENNALDYSQTLLETISDRIADLAELEFEILQSHIKDITSKGRASSDECLKMIFNAINVSPQSTSIDSLVGSLQQMLLEARTAKDTAPTSLRSASSARSTPFAFNF